MYIKMFIKTVKCGHNPKRMASKLLWRWITLNVINFKSHFFQFLNFTCQKNRDVQEIHRDMRGLETI